MHALDTHLTSVNQRTCIYTKSDDKTVAQTELQILTPPTLPSFLQWALTYRHLLYLEGEKERGRLGEGPSILLAFPFSPQFDTNHLRKVWG